MVYSYIWLLCGKWILAWWITVYATLQHGVCSGIFSYNCHVNTLYWWTFERKASQFMKTKTETDCNHAVMWKEVFFVSHLWMWCYLIANCAVIIQIHAVWDHSSSCLLLYVNFNVLRFTFITWRLLGGLNFFACCWYLFMLHCCICYNEIFACSCQKWT